MISTSYPSRILIVDDAPAVREALRWVLEDTPDLEVAGEAGDGSEAVASAIRLAPDVVVLDLHLPGINGYDVARWLKSLRRPPLVVFLSVDGDVEARRRAIEAGGDAFALKAAGWDSLLAEIRFALAGRAKGAGHA
jgi:DNA-binding NarL/FixJ family response regulator